MRQAQIFHVADEVLDANTVAQAGVVASLFGYRARAATVVVVSRIDREIPRQGEQTLADGMKQLPRIAVLEIRSACAADQQRVTAEHHFFLVKHETEATPGVTGSRAHLEPQLTELDHLAVLEAAVVASSVARLGHGNLAA